MGDCTGRPADPASVRQGPTGGAQRPDERKRARTTRGRSQGKGHGAVFRKCRHPPWTTPEPGSPRCSTPPGWTAPTRTAAPRGTARPFRARSSAPGAVSHRGRSCEWHRGALDRVLPVDRRRQPPGGRTRCQSCWTRDVLIRGGRAVCFPSRTGHGSAAMPTGFQPAGRDRSDHRSDHPVHRPARGHWVRASGVGSCRSAQGVVEAVPDALAAVERWWGLYAVASPTCFPAIRQSNSTCSSTTSLALPPPCGRRRRTFAR